MRIVDNSALPGPQDGTLLGQQPRARRTRRGADFLPPHVPFDDAVPPNLAAHSDEFGDGASADAAEPATASDTGETQAPADVEATLPEDAAAAVDGQAVQADTAEAAEAAADAEDTEDASERPIPGDVVLEPDGPFIVVSADGGMAPIWDVYDMAQRTLTGDLRDFIIDRIKHNHDKRPWKDRSENDQRDLVRATESACNVLVRTAIDLINAARRHGIAATLAQVTVKDECKAVLEVPRHEERLMDLIQATGGRVTILIASAAEFTGERAPAPIDPDQKDLMRAAQQAHENATASTTKAA